MKWASPLWLASRSPRRKQILSEAGFDVRVVPPDFDDGELRSGRVSPYVWVKALAYLKAWRVVDLVRGLADRTTLWHEPWSNHGMTGTVLAADTMCVMQDQILGQPRDADDARRMLQLMRDATHETVTGVCLISLETGFRINFCDAARVEVGEISDAAIEKYIASGEWRGKAGAYNLSERLADNWPITCAGDPLTVMGLPMQKLLQIYNPRNG